MIKRICLVIAPFRVFFKISLYIGRAIMEIPKVPEANSFCTSIKMEKKKIEEKTCLQKSYLLT